MPVGYCLKCKTKREIANPTPVTLKGGRPAIKGVCSVCGTPMVVMGKLT